jgi:hypothetical protein
LAPSENIEEQVQANVDGGETSIEIDVHQLVY